MQPRGQLWFALEALVRDFRECSGLSEKDGLKVLIAVLSNMLEDTKTELAKLNAPPSPPAAPETQSLP